MGAPSSAGQLSEHLSTHFTPKIFNMSFWRVAGLNYVQYSAIAARTVRQVLKEPLKTTAAKREGSAIKITEWKDGKVIKNYFPDDAPGITSISILWQAK